MPDENPGTGWHIALIPVFMAIGSPGLLVTLAALSRGATVAHIGLLNAGGAVTAIVFSVIWGRLSDFSGIRKRYLLILFVTLGPIFLALSIANSVIQLIILYALLTAVTSGVSPIAVMYTVECCRGGDWVGGLARYNSLASVGNIFGLLVYTLGAQFFDVSLLFVVSAVLCLVAAVLMWKTGSETVDKRKRLFISRRLDARDLLPLNTLRHFLLEPRSVVPKNIQPFQLLILASFIHWIGINFWGVGQTPFMKEIGLSNSLILAVNFAGGISTAIAFVAVAPKTKSKHALINRLMAIRGFLILLWAVFPVLLAMEVSLVFVAPLIVQIAWGIFYAALWLPISSFAVSQAPANHKGTLQAELLSAISMGNAIGSGLGGIVFVASGYTVGFVLAAMITVLAIPVVTRINITSQAR